MLPKYTPDPVKKLYLFVCIQYVVLGLKSGQLCQPRHTSMFPNTLPMLLQSMHTHFECLKRRHCDCEEEKTLVMNENWVMTWTTPLLHTPPSLVPTQLEAHDLDGGPASKLLNFLVQVQLGERPLMRPAWPASPGCQCQEQTRQCVWRDSGRGTLKEGGSMHVRELGTCECQMCIFETFIGLQNWSRIESLKTNNASPPLPQ